MRVMGVVGAGAHDRKQHLCMEVSLDENQWRQGFLQGRQERGKDMVDSVWGLLGGHYLLSKLGNHVVISVRALFLICIKALRSHFAVSPEDSICSEYRPFSTDAIWASTSAAITGASKATEKGCLGGSGG